MVLRGGMLEKLPSARPAVALLPRSMTIDTTTSITGTAKSKKPAGKVYSEGGEVEVMKGGDYIKDLID